MIRKLLASVMFMGSPAPVSAHGKASWYGDEHQGMLMANGFPFDKNDMTCASWDYPFGTILKVTYTTRAGVKRRVLVTVTDRGPNKRLGRAIDLSEAAFRVLENPRVGVISVDIEVVKR